MSEAQATPNDTVTPPETQPAQSAATTGGEAKFTQADLDRIAGETRQKATEAARKKAFADLGIEDPAADAELLKEAKARKEADKSEVERISGKLTAAEQRAAKAEADLEAERNQRRIDARDHAIKTALRAAQVKNADKTFAVLTTLKKTELEAVLNAEGQVDEKKVTSLVDIAKAEYAEDFGAAPLRPGTPSHAGGRGGQRKVDPKDIKTSGNIN